MYSLKDQKAGVMSWVLHGGYLNSLSEGSEPFISWDRALQYSDQPGSKMTTLIMLKQGNLEKWSLKWEPKKYLKIPQEKELHN